LLAPIEDSGIVVTDSLHLSLSLLIHYRDGLVLFDLHLDLDALHLLVLQLLVVLDGLIVDELEGIGVVGTQMNCVLGGEHIELIDLLVALLLLLLVHSVQSPVAFLEDESDLVLHVIVVDSLHIESVLVSQVLVVDQLLIAHAVALLELETLVQELQAAQRQVELFGDLVGASLQVAVQLILILSQEGRKSCQ
jgi:hypothetical protein